MSTATTKARPILFSAPMVNAIQEGRKTQTRRVAEPLNNPMPHHQPCEYRYANGRVEVSVRGGPWREIRVGKGKNGEGNPCRCPYGEPGDALWVRETWGLRKPCYAGEEPPESVTVKVDRYGINRWIEYAADCDTSLPHNKGCWKPSIHMPRWASRITLEITDVRVELVGEISDADVFAEGVYDYDVCTCSPELCIDQVRYCGTCGHRLEDTAGDFAHLWDSINAGRGYGWNANPWVWVVGFRRIEPPQPQPE